MKTYNLPKHVTLHDVAEELGRPRQTISLWLRRHKIPSVQIILADRVACTMIPYEYLKKLRKLSADLDERRGDAA